MVCWPCYKHGSMPSLAFGWCHEAIRVPDSLALAPLLHRRLPINQVRRQVPASKSESPHPRPHRPRSSAFQDPSTSIIAKLVTDWLRYRETRRQAPQTITSRFPQAGKKAQTRLVRQSPPPRSFQGLLKRLLPPAAAHHTGRIARIQGPSGRNKALGSASCGDFGPLPLVGTVSRSVSVSAFAECRCISPDRGDPPPPSSLPTLTT